MDRKCRHCGSGVECLVGLLPFLPTRFMTSLPVAQAPGPHPELVCHVLTWNQQLPPLSPSPARLVLCGSGHGSPPRKEQP